MYIQLNEDDLSVHGISIGVKGFAGETTSTIPEQVYIEIHDGNLKVHVWNGHEDPAASILIPRE